MLRWHLVLRQQDRGVGQAGQPACEQQKSCVGALGLVWGRATGVIELKMPEECILSGENLFFLHLYIDLKASIRPVKRKPTPLSNFIVQVKSCRRGGRQNEESALNNSGVCSQKT
jgi:hypothetical protein